MDSKRPLIGVGLACFVVFVMASAPAQLLTDLVASDDGLRFIGVTGSIWNGETRSIQTPFFQLHKTSWSLHATDLLGGRLGARIETEWPGGFASGDIRIGIGGVISLHDFEATGPIMPFIQILHLPITGGEFVVEVSELEIADAWPRSAIGSVRVGNLPLTLAGVGAGPTGSYEVSFDADPVGDDGRLAGRLTSFSGPLTVAGTLLLSPPANYEINARIKAGPGAPVELARALQLLGPIDADGNREFIMSGSL